MVQNRQEATDQSRHDDKSLIAALVGDGRPLLIFTGLSLILSGAFALFLSINQQFLPHDVQFLGMTAEQLCGINNCRVVVHPVVGYTNLFHLAPAILGAIIFVLGLALCYPAMHLRTERGRNRSEAE